MTDKCMKVLVVEPHRDNVVLVCNEEGKLDGLPINRVLRDERGVPYDAICGTFFLVGTDEENCCSLTQKQIDRYTKEFSIGMHRHKKTPSHEER